MRIRDHQSDPAETTTGQLTKERSPERSRPPKGRYPCRGFPAGRHGQPQRGLARQIFRATPRQGHRADYERTGRSSALDDKRAPPSISGRSFPQPPSWPPTHRPYRLCWTPISARNGGKAPASRSPYSARWKHQVTYILFKDICGASSCCKVSAPLMSHPDVDPAIFQAAAARRGRAYVYEKIVPARTALIVIDLQNAFMRVGAPSEVPSARLIVPAVNRLAEAVRRNGGTIAWVQATFERDGWPLFFDHMVRPELAARILAALRRTRPTTRFGPSSRSQPTISSSRISLFCLPAGSKHAAGDAAWARRRRHCSDRRMYDKHVLRFSARDAVMTDSAPS